MRSKLKRKAPGVETRQHSRVFFVSYTKIISFTKNRQGDRSMAKIMAEMRSTPELHLEIRARQVMNLLVAKRLQSLARDLRL